MTKEFDKASKGMSLPEAIKKKKNLEDRKKMWLGGKTEELGSTNSPEERKEELQHISKMMSEDDIQKLSEGGEVEKLVKTDKDGKVKLTSGPLAGHTIQMDMTDVEESKQPEAEKDSIPEALPAPKTPLEEVSESYRKASHYSDGGMIKKKKRLMEAFKARGSK